MQKLKEEIELRALIWEAISNFYLDTELQSDDYDYIAKILLQSNLTLDELKDIDLYEVFPSLQMNLLSIAGEWAGFEMNWLKEKCSANWEKRNSMGFRIYIKVLNFLFYWMRSDCWKEIEERMD